MVKTYKLIIKNNDPFEEINDFFKGLFEHGIIDALLAPQQSPAGKSVLQALIKDKKEIKNINPFAPLLLMNSATMVGRLTLNKPKERIGVVLRSCEIRATIELAKLKQVNLENLIIIGIDCLGTYEPKVYEKTVLNLKDTKKLTMEFLEGAKNELRLACQTCEYPNPLNADIAINFFGYDINKEILIQISDKMDEKKFENLRLEKIEDISKWQEASAVCINKRTEARDKLFKEVLEETKDIKGFLKALELCRRCYNCRRECPICYCKECIFDSLTFEHESSQYLRWAERKGKIRMPSDTLLFHLTRLNHMVISCVGCGQCTSACPNDIPVAKFFKTIGFKVQELFNYKPGAKLEEEIPQSTFKEDEFQKMGT